LKNATGMTLHNARHIFAVPTHRRIPAFSLDSFFDEVRHARISRGIEMPLVIADDGVDNTSSIALAQERYPDVCCVRFGDADVAALFDAMQAQLGAAPREALRFVRDPRRPNYGNAYNRLYLIAAMFGAQVLHRRDADTRAQLVRDANGQLEPLHPIELELAHIGRTVDGRRVTLVGGGYSGASSMDIGHLSADVTLLRRFYRLLSVSDELSDRLLAAPAVDPSHRGEPLAFNGPATPECGNIAIGDAFELLPCSPAPYALGTDYFTLNCLFRLDFGRLTHNRNVVHAYTGCRYDTSEKLYFYWRGMAAFVLDQSFYRPLQRRLACEHGSLGRADNLLHARDAVVNAMRRHRQLVPVADHGAMVAEFLELAGLKPDPRMAQILARLHSEQAVLIEQMQLAIDHHAMLIDAWPDIIRAAKAVGATSALFRKLARGRHSREAESSVSLS
jgi:hypothetical protein